MKRILRHILPAALCLSVFEGCMKWDYDTQEELSATGTGLFITNEGMFQYGNASLSYYDPETKQVENEVFRRANGFKLGDVAQSMTIRDGVGWVVVNNSHVIFAIDINTFKELGRITNLSSSRYMHFISDEKAYVTQIWTTASSSSTPNATRSQGTSNVRTWGCSRAPRNRWCNTANTSS